MSQRPWLVLVGGFLGAGKTTLILAAARELKKRGLRSAAILNDQGSDLVDTRMAHRDGLASDEITGGCFCCRFSDMVGAANRLRQYSPDVIFAEPVGSCTDITATTMLPLREEYANEFRLAPFTVLVDPARAIALSAPDADPAMSFLFRKQLDEADLICLTKSDSGTYDWGFCSDARVMSAKTGQGVAAWLDEVLSGTLTVAGKVLDIDYTEYARAEAALAWLNLELTLTCPRPLSPAMVLGPLLDGIDSGLTAAGISLVHLKATDDSPAGFLKAAICASGEDPAIQGALDASPAERHELRINLRAVGKPEQVRGIVEACIARLPGEISGLNLACFSPSAPSPERRFTAAITWNESSG